MPELLPLPFADLIRRMFYEFRREGKIFDLIASKFWKGTANGALNTGVRFHGRPAGTALGPAAGPQTQMAQNLVLSWLGGSRILELKTIQTDDRLVIGRPCIDATNVGYNIEFSQELLLHESLDEYVKGWMLIRMLEEEEILGVAKRAKETRDDELPHFYDCIFDLSCGYNLEGIKSERMQRIIWHLIDATETIERLRTEIPDEFARFRKLEFDPKIVTTATLSTFHGCPADEIEKIVDFLVRENRLHTIIKMNPTMLGGQRLKEMLHDTMGYTEMTVNPAALTSGLQFDDSITITRRLRKTAHERNLFVGAKFNNTLEVLNHRDFFQNTEKVMYMSGLPLHPIAVELSLKYREAYLRHCDAETDLETQEDGYIPISFSAGVDKTNFPECVAAGFTPITTCTDLLRPGGYQRTVEYMKTLEAAMVKVGAKTVDEFIAARAGVAMGTKTSGLENHKRIARETLADSRYYKARNAVIPKRINNYLGVFDCITCDKCIPVCPNDANFTYETPEAEFSYQDYFLANGRIVPVDDTAAILKLKKAHQIANFAAFCNQCGNCDTFCPEYGGPFIQKPTFFSDYEQWKEFRTYDGFIIQRSEAGEEIHGRMMGKHYWLRVPPPVSEGATALHLFGTPFGDVTIDPGKIAPVAVLHETSHGPIEMKTYLTLRILLNGVLHASKINYVNAGQPDLLAVEP